MKSVNWFRGDDVLVNNIPCQPQPDIHVCILNEFI